MAGEWKVLPLSAVCEQIVDCPHSTPTWTSHGVIVLRNQNIRNGRLDLSSPSYTDEMHYEDRSRRARLRAGDIVITREAPMGEVCMVPTGLKCCLGQRMVMLRPDSRLCDPHYLLYSLQSPAVQHEILVNEGTGSTVSNLRIPLLKALRVQVPKLAEQRAIAHILGTLDDKIELNRRMNETLEGMARAIFKSWFVDFEPVRAKADGRQPAGMDAATAALFPDSFEDSPLGKIPKGWKVGTIYEIAEVIYGAPFSSKLFNTNGVGIPLVRIRDLATEAPAVHTTEHHPKGYLIQPGDIVVGMDGEFRAYLWGGIESWLNQRVCVFRPVNGCSPVFVRNSIIAPLAAVEATETATTVIHLGKNDIDRFAMLIPANELRSAYGRECQPLYSRMVANKRESSTLVDLRDSLLPKLLSGEIRVAEAEELIEAGV